MGTSARAWWLGAVSLAALAYGPACGTDAVGVETCRTIEEARCQQAATCGDTLQPPYHTSGSDVSACMRFYDDACLHGLASGKDPGAAQAKLCVQAIQSNCALVLHPETDPNCAWLAADAGSATDGAPEDASDADAATD